MPKQPCPFNAPARERTAWDNKLVRSFETELGGRYVVATLGCRTRGATSRKVEGGVVQTVR